MSVETNYAITIATFSDWLKVAMTRNFLVPSSQELSK